MSFRIDLHDVERGECIVLDSGGEILMVDCGSSSRIIRAGDVNFFDYVRSSLMPLYAGARRRSFLLTHCHRDHICGLWHILRSDPLYFDRLFLPVSPVGGGGRPLLLEFALYVYVFLSRATEYSQVNTGVLRLFRRAVRRAGAERVFPVRAGDVFPFGGAEYEVLWPPEEDFPFAPEFAAAVDRLDALMSPPVLPPCAQEFLNLRQAFCAQYRSFCASSPVSGPGVSAASGLLARMGGLVPSLRLLPFAGRAAGFLSSSGVQRLYSQALNAASVVFQNRRGRLSPHDILMTGDAPPETIAAVAPSLREGYFCLKAPHHGSQSSFSPVLGSLAADHILISSGASGSAGAVSPAYAAMPGVCHCTSCASCAAFQSGGCCGRLKVCYSLSRPALAVACPFASSGRGSPPCGVRVLTPLGVRGCFCG